MQSMHIIAILNYLQIKKNSNKNQIQCPNQSSFGNKKDFSRKIDKLVEVVGVGGVEGNFEE